MASSASAKDPIVYPFTPAADYSAKAGYAVTVAGDICTLMASASATYGLVGVIVEGSTTSGKCSVVPTGTGYCVPVKLSASPGTVTYGSLLGTHTDGSFTLAASGGNIVARAMEGGAANALISALLNDPKNFD